MSTGCEFYGDALVELARGELEPERRARVERHLEVCRDCRDGLAVVRAVLGAQAPVPHGLEARVRAAVSAPEPRLAPATRTRSWGGWRVWGLPLAAAAALAVWLGGELLDPGVTGEPAGTEGAAATYDPYGAWPASDGLVAGEVVLSDLSVEELEALLEELEP